LGFLNACGGSSKEPATATATPNVVQPGAPGEPTRKAAPGTGQSAAPSEADVEFVQDMIHHHAQAIQMTAWVPDRSASTSVKLLAERMAISQQSEIELMQDWLKRQGVPPVDANDHAGHMSMPGMLTQPQLDRLRADSGRAFDRLFLRYMTHHHRGALTMVHRLRDQGGGNQSDLDAFMRNVEIDQQIEIDRMQQLLSA
jgi:uncharacterized protein (DUF305 family)